MSLNIAPPLPHNIVNAAAPATESLARANAVKEVVPAPVQVEASLPQKSREQDTRSPVADNPTYDNIKQNSESSVIPDDPLADGEQGSNDQQEQSAGSDDQKNASEENEQEQQIEQKEREIEIAQAKADQQAIQELKLRDDEVRAHEQAHASVGGGYAGSPKYQYETGPNGQKYAVSGEVSIDVSKAATPQDTIKKMQTVRAAALAPAEPSGQDRKVAAEASQKIAEARADLIQEKTNFSQDDESDELQVNTDSPIGQEPRKRSLENVYGSDDASSTSENQDYPQQQSSMTLEHGESVALQVIQNRYAQSYQLQSTAFSAQA